MCTRKKETLTLVVNEILYTTKIQLHLDFKDLNSDLASHCQSCYGLGRRANYLTISQVSHKLNANDSTRYFMKA